MTNYLHYSLKFAKILKLNLFFPMLVWLVLIDFNPLIAKPAPNSFSDLVEKLSPSVVNITSSSLIPNRQGQVPKLPPGSPFEDFFRDFLDKDEDGSPRRSRRGTALGSGFIISSDGLVK